MEELTALVQLIKDGGAIVVLIVGMYGFYKEWWVMGSTFRRALKWQEIAYEERALSRQAVSVAKSVA